MTKDEFILTLQNALSGMHRADLERTVQYYREMIEDRMEEGMSEEAAVADVGDPIELAEAIRGKPVKRTAVSTPKAPKAPKERKPMGRGKRVALTIIAVFMAIAGVLLVGDGAVRGASMLTKGGVNMAKTFTFNQPISDILIDCGDEDVALYRSTDGSTKVVCPQDSTRTYYVHVEDGTLHVERENRSKLFHFDLLVRQVTVHVYLPEERYESLYIENASGKTEVPAELRFRSAVVKNSSGKIRFAAQVSNELNLQSHSGSVTAAYASPETLFLSSTSGSVHLYDCEAGEVTLSSTSGSVEVERVKCGSFSAKCTSGSQKFSDVLVKGLLRIDGTSGSVKLTDCDAGEVQIEVSSGSVSGNFLTPKQYDLRATSGSVRAPSSAAPSESGTAGRCTVRTTSGSIRFD